MCPIAVVALLAPRNYFCEAESFLKTMEATWEGRQFIQQLRAPVNFLIDNPIIL